MRFLVAVHAAIGVDARLVVRRPAPLTWRLIVVTSLDTILTFDASERIADRHPFR